MLSEAKQAAADGLKLSPTSQGVDDEAALAFAMAGDTARAESMAEELNKRFPLDTQMQSLWLPAIRAQVLLDRKKSAAEPSRVCKLRCPLSWDKFRSSTTSPASIQPTFAVKRILPRAQGNRSRSRVPENSGPSRHRCGTAATGALAHLQIGRAYAMQGDTAKAKAAYQDFLALWKDADPNIPILIAAKSEYAKLP